MLCLRSVELKYKIWWQFKFQKYYEDFYGKKLLEGRLAPSHINSIKFRDLKMLPFPEYIT